ncbi:MAG: hypothetical protein U0T74_04610 [Chitinophagales bacterium]
MKKTNVIFLAFLLWVNMIRAQTNVWLGNTAQWINGSNWSLGASPNSCSSDVLIPAAPSGGIFPVMGPAISPTVGNLTIQDGATLTVGLTLNVCGNITGGTSSFATITGNGVVNLMGSGSQDISGQCHFNKLTLNNTSSFFVTVSGDITISKVLLLQDGDLLNNGSVTLQSDISGSAYIDFFTYPVGNSYSGPITVEQYVSNTADGYRDISLPVSATVAEVANDFTVAGQNGVNCWYTYSPYPTLQEYREDANTDTSNYYGGFWSFTNPSTYFEPMRGYAARIYNAPLTLSATGNMNYGSQLIQVTNTPSLTPSADGWNLIGNPYPAPIKWSSVKALNAGKTDGSCYRFTTSGEYAGTWSAHNGVTGVPLSTTDEISTFQGFFVLAPATDFLFMENSVCTPGNSVEFYKTESLTDEIRLQITNGSVADEAVAYTDVNATAGYDAGYDAVKIPAGSSAHISYVIPGKVLAIQVLNELTEQTVLPLNVRVAANGVYTINPLALNLDGLTAYLRDAQTNTLYNLSVTAATFNLAAEQDYTGRFSVVFKNNEVSGISEKGPASIQINAASNDIAIHRLSDQPAQISVWNLLGQQLAQVNTVNQDIAMQLSLDAAQYVFVKVKEGTQTKMAKVFITTK